MNEVIQSRWVPVLLLAVSNVFMTFAWYGHLKFKQSPLWIVILASWGIAFFEYCVMVPANRWGHSRYSATELKIIQEVVTLSVFTGFVIAYLGERVRWNHFAAFLCILAAVAFTFWPGARETPPRDEQIGQIAAATRQ
ncbi:MAG: DMT family protein [Verrucomicrobia bacterium]|nr:DMT family protein [Verrucomicrobiota bacterium]